MPPAMKFVRVLLSVAAVMFLAGCGTSPAPTVSGSTPTPVDVAAAKQAAMGLFVADPSATAHWIACSNSNNWAACPLSVTVKARLAELTSSGYFGDTPPGKCGEEYISGTQNGLSQAPTALSAVAESNGSVTVVIHRGPSSPPSLTAVMTDQNGTWLATDLASGTGASASIFSAQPSC
jgi:hypothetical protein